jgi:hypothetical protein
MRAGIRVGRHENSTAATELPSHVLPAGRFDVSESHCPRVGFGFQAKLSAPASCGAVIYAPRYRMLAGPGRGPDSWNANPPFTYLARERRRRGLASRLAE